MPWFRRAKEVKKHPREVAAEQNSPRHESPLPSDCRAWSFFPLRAIPDGADAESRLDAEHACQVEGARNGRMEKR